MDRVKSGGWSAAIEAAVDALPLRLAELASCHFFCGASPLFAGLHEYGTTDGGHSYEQVYHAVYPYHQTKLSVARQHPTIVLPRVPSPETVTHELGHIIHWRIGFDVVLPPLTEYAHTNRYEAFAEAFWMWMWDQPVPEQVRNLFERLAWP